MMSHVQYGRAHMHYVIQGFFKLNWSLVELSQWYAIILSAIALMLFLWCLRLYVGFQWIFSLKFEHLDFKLFRFFFPYCQIVAVAETCCWYYIDAQTIKLCLLTCLLSDCWLCNKTPSNLGGKKKNIHTHLNHKTKKFRFVPHKASFFICIQRGEKPSSAQTKLSDHASNPPLLKCTSFLWPPLPPVFVT